MKQTVLRYLSHIVTMKTRVLLRGRLLRSRLWFNVVMLSGDALNRTPRDTRVIVSLTSFPERIRDLHFTLCSLLTQTFKPDAIILWLAEEQFPGKESDLPDNVLKMKRYGVTINWCRDLKSYKKLVPALRAYPDAVIVTADDDIYYQDKWLELLYQGYVENPACISCHRAHTVTFDGDRVSPYREWLYETHEVRVSMLNFATSGAGVLYPPSALHPDVLDEDLFLRLSPLADDVWFWAMAVLNNTGISVVRHNISRFIDIRPERSFGYCGGYMLSSVNCGENKNDEQIRNVLVHYTGLYEKLRTGCGNSLDTVAEEPC